MAVVVDAGRVCVSTNLVRWTLTDFFNLPQSADTWILSPRFRFEDKDWELRLFPNGSQLFSSEGWVGMSLFNWSDSHSPFSVRLAFTDDLGEEMVSSNAEDFCGRAFQAWRLIRRSDFESLRDLVAPTGALSVICEIQKLKDDPGADAVYNRYEMERKLKRNLERLSLTCINSDGIPQVNGEEIGEDENIQAASSPFFSDVTNDEVKKKVIVATRDNESDSFPAFLNYLHTGIMEDMTSKNALNLYATADSYHMDELKSTCVQYMMNNISKFNFCGVLTLSLRHQEKELTDGATQFFLENSKEIMSTDEWRTFLSENPEAGNELLTKAED